VVGQILARLLEQPFIDIDEEITGSQGQSVESIFSEHGESYFRDLESQKLNNISSGSSKIISTGGGIVINPENREIMRKTGFVIHLETSPQVVLERMLADSKGESRPLLDTQNPIQDIQDLRLKRAPFYYDSDWVVKTDQLSPVEVANLVINGLEIIKNKNPKLPDTYSGSKNPNAKTINVQTESSNYEVILGLNIIEDIGQIILSRLGKSKCHLIIDSAIEDIFANLIHESLNKANIEFNTYSYSGGEENKNLDSASEMYAWLSEVKAERSDIILAVGGGVTGDLAGFVAATYARGLKVIHVPTTLLAMVDSSIGGKVAIDLPAGKNLVGAFHQPSLVVSDIASLSSLPTKEMVSGWAEIIKTALAFDVSLINSLDELKFIEYSDITNEILLDIVYRTAKIKSNVITIDEKETTGLRSRLNYGHTLGHAIEAAGKYKMLTHGECVALGMVFASTLALALGIIDQDFKEKHDNLIASFGLPTKPPSQLEIKDVLNSMKRDKKIVDGKLTWILSGQFGYSKQYKDIATSTYLPLVESFLRSTE
jgi:shikimate kinase/3-dehydroquinate synthase